MAYIWLENNRIYKLPIYQEYNDGRREYCWQETEEKYYNLYNYRPLPPAGKIIESPDMYLAESLKITCLYKNGMDSNGFEKNITGTGVSVVEKKIFMTEYFPIYPQWYTSQKCQ